LDKGPGTVGGAEVRSFHGMRENMEAIKIKVRNFIVDNFLFGQANGLLDDTSFLEAGILDSTGVLEVVGFLEGQFGIRVDDDELTPENLDSIASIAGYVSHKLPT
jgi:acyl carrier protein